MQQIYILNLLKRKNGTNKLNKPGNVNKTYNDILNKLKKENEELYTKQTEFKEENIKIPYKYEKTLIPTENDLYLKARSRCDLINPKIVEERNKKEILQLELIKKYRDNIILKSKTIKKLFSIKKI